MVGEPSVIRTLFCCPVVSAYFSGNLEKLEDFRFLYFSVLNKVINYCFYKPLIKCFYNSKVQVIFQEADLSINLKPHLGNRVEHINSTETSYLKRYYQPQKSFQIKFQSNSLLMYVRLCFVKNDHFNKETHFLYNWCSFLQSLQDSDVKLLQG